MSGRSRTLDERVEANEDRIVRCRQSLSLAESGQADALKRDLLSQVPAIVAPSGSLPYRDLVEARLRFHASSLDSSGDRLELTAVMSCDSKPHTYRFEWRWAGDGRGPRAQHVTSEVKTSIPTTIYEAAKAAATRHLEHGNLWPFDREGSGEGLDYSGEALWRLSAPTKDGRFDRTTSIRWRLVFGCSGPRWGGSMPDSEIWHGHGVDYEFLYDPASGEVELSEQHWIT